jgi:hypothetical protein
VTGARTVFEEVAELEGRQDVTDAFLVVTDNAGIEAVSRLSQLQSLRLTYHGDSPNLEPLLKLPKLRRFELSIWVPLAADDVAATPALRVLSSLPELEWFKLYLAAPDNLYENRLKKAQAEIPRLPHLKHLIVDGHHFEFTLAPDFPFSLLQTLEFKARMNDGGCMAKMPQLKSLIVDGEQTLTQAGLDCFGGLKNLERFEGLRVDLLPLSSWKGMKELSTSNVDSEGIARIVAKLPDVERLSLSICACPDRSLAELAKLANLKSLSLEVEFDPGRRRFRLAGDGSGLSALGKISNLEELHLTCMPLTETLMTAVSEIRSLRKLSISRADNYLTPAMASLLNKLTNIEELSVPWPEKGRVACLRECQDLSRLTSLDLQGQLMTDDEVQMLEKFPNLQYLSLIDNALTDACLPTLARLSRLKGLYLANNPIQGRALGGIVALPCLTELDLRGTRITDAALEGQKIASESLEWLDLSSTQISGPGLKFISDLGSLKTLRLADSLISDAGLKHISSSSLETINLESTDVTERGLASLMPLPKLKVVEGNNSGIRRGADVPPHVQVFCDDNPHRIDYDDANRSLIFELDERLITGRLGGWEDSELDYHRRGDLHVSVGEFAAAVVEYEKAIDELLHPEYHLCSMMREGHDYRLFECYDSRGMALAALGEFDRAFEDISEAVKICRISAVARAHRGFVLFKMGNLEAALEDLNRAIEMKPNFGAAYDYRSRVFEAQGKADLAAKDRETSRQLGYKL